MERASKGSLVVLALLAAGHAIAAGGDLGQAEKQPTNWVAISMFGAFAQAAKRSRCGRRRGWGQRGRRGIDRATPICRRNPTSR